MNAEKFLNNGFGADVEKVHRKHVIELMTNFAKHYHTEQCNIANVVGQSEQFYCSSSDDGQYPRCETQCLGCAGLEEQAKQ